MKRNSPINTVILACSFFLLHSCTFIPKNAKAVDKFNVNQYMGTWYEIARMDFRFERNLDNTSAQYQLDKNRNVRVLNSGYNFIKKKWTKADALAKFRGDPNVAALKVSFFGPFYSGYNVVALDEQYQYALIAGKNLDYLWILSRTKSIPDSTKANYLQIASEIGFDTTKLIWVKHDRKDNPYLNEN